MDSGTQTQQQPRNHHAFCFHLRVEKVAHLRSWCFPLFLLPPYSFPDHAYFMWVCAHRDIDAFRWLIRNIKDAQDEVCHMRATSPQQMHSKSFEFHIWVTSVPEGTKPIDVIVGEDDEIGSVLLRTRTAVEGCISTCLSACPTQHARSCALLLC